MASLADFYALSVVLTGYDRASLQGTGVGETYYDTLTTIVGQPISDELLAVFAHIESQGLSPEERDLAIRREIMASRKLGPVARNIIKMWYTANWYQMPDEWADEFGTFVQDDCGNYLDTDHVISAAAYDQGLQWLAFEAHPMGGKQPGYGTWTVPPHEESV